MALVSLTTADGLTGPRNPVTLRTEDISALWVENNSAAPGPVVALMRSGEMIALETVSPAQAEPLYNRIRGAL